MNYIHSNHTAPFKLRKPKEKYDIEDFEILTTILSALYIKKNPKNKISMFADLTSADFYYKNKLNTLWDNIDLCALESLNKSKIDFEEYWAIGKLKAIKETKGPVVSLDTDFILLKEDYSLYENFDVVAAHNEFVGENSAYRKKHLYKKPKGYEFDKKLDWLTEAFNTSFLYIKDESFKELYINEVFKFVTNNERYDEKVLLTQMCFIEQRMISMLCKKFNKKTSVLKKIEFSKNGIFTDRKSDVFYHTWGYKKKLRRNNNKRYLFCKFLVEKIKKEFESDFHYIENIKKLQKFI